MFKLVHDDVHTHDMTFMACNPAFYDEKGLKGHRSCAENIAEAMKPWGMESYLDAASVDPFNVFQNTPDMSLKDLGCSRPGDYVEFEVLKDAVVGVSSCPYDVVSTPFRFVLAVEHTRYHVLKSTLSFSSLIVAGEQSSDDAAMVSSMY